MSLETWVNNKDQKILDGTREYLTIKFQIPNQEINDWKKDYDELSKDYDELLQRHAALEEKYEQVEKRYALSITQRLEIDEVCDDFEKERQQYISEFQTKLEQELKDQLEKHEAEIAGLRRDIRRAEMQAEGAKQAYNIFFEAYKAMEQDRTRARSDADALWKASLRDQSKYDELLAEFEKLKKTWTPPAPHIPTNPSFGLFIRPAGMCTFGGLA